MLLGLTGMYCAGKNFIASLLEKRGLPVLDVDKLGHSAIENQKDSIAARFGDDILDGNGTVNRRLLGEKVFGKADELAALEEIVHPEANRLTLEWIAAQNGNHCVINAALLHKSVVFDRLDGILLVTAPWPVRLVRAKQRDKLPWTVLIQRFSTQKHFMLQYAAGNADIYKVKNPGIGKLYVEKRIDTILSKLG